MSFIDSKKSPLFEWVRREKAIFKNTFFLALIVLCNNPPLSANFESSSLLEFFWLYGLK